jgi:hypothetical protein
MRRTIVVGAATLALGFTVGAGRAAAQATLGWDAALFSSYVWRGVSLTGKPVFEPDLYLTFPIGAASLTAGGWANIDIGKYDGSTDISESGGSSAFNFAEFDPWVEVAIPAGIATITPGATAYIYPNKLGFTKESNTEELYLKVGLSTFLSPKVSAYYDVDKVKGLYVEGSVTHGIPLGATTLNLGVLAGWTGGQEIDSDKSDNFDSSGLTHVDLSANVGFSAGPVSITPSIHGVIGSDRRTKFTKGASNAYGFNDTSFKLWGGVTISWSKALGASKEPAAE